MKRGDWQATRRQRGAALLVSLMILLVISLIGVTAMKTSMFNSKIATSSQGVNMAFFAAESAIEATLLEILSTNNTEIMDAMIVNSSAGTFTPVYRCVTSAGIFQDVCADTQFLDQRGLVRAETRSVMTGMSGLAGEAGTTTQISQTGGGSVIFADYTFLVGGVGRVPVLNVNQYVLQEFSKVGLYTGGE